MASNYHHTAWFYDALARLVYGQAIVKAQTIYLNRIPANSRVLIAGGGTGYLLTAISKLHSNGLYICYAELATNMMRRAQKRAIGQNQVDYVNAPVESLPLNTPAFDVIITPFLFDSLLPATQQNVFTHLHHLLKPGGIWLYTDFVTPTTCWQKILLKSMYLFFKLMGCLETQNLSPVAPLFNAQQYRVQAFTLFYKGFIGSTLYVKP